MPEPVIVAVDHQQRRIYPSAVTVAIRDAELYDPAHSSSVFLDPVHQMAMLKPLQLEENWWTTNSGDYTKYSLAAGYEVNTLAKWREVELFENAGKFLQCDDAIGEWVRTSVAVGLNRGMMLTYFAYAAGDKKILFECGYAGFTVSAENAGTGFKVFTDGTIEVWRDGRNLGTYTISGAGAASSRSTQNELVTLIILPCRRRELVIFSTAGQGFYVVLEDIMESEESPVITANENFFVKPGSDVTNLQLQFCPLRFPESGILTSYPYRFAKPPRSTQTLFDGWANPTFGGVSTASLFGDTAYAGLATVSAVEIRNENNTGAFVADDETTALRIQQSITSDKSYSPFIYGVIVEFVGEVVGTDDSEHFVLNDYVNTMSLTVADDPLGVTLSLILNRVKESVELTGDPEEPVLVDMEHDLLSMVPGIDTQSYRPVELVHEGVRIVDAYVKEPRFIDEVDYVSHRIQIEAYEVARLLEEAVFRSRVPFDGWPLCQPLEYGYSAVAYVLERAGLDLTLARFSDLNFIIGEVPSSSGEWNVTAEEGDTCAQVLEKLHRLCADCVYGSHPTEYGMGFWWVSPEDLADDLPVVGLYRTLAAAQEAYPTLSEEEAADFLYHSFREENLAVEANEVRATGVDPRTQQPIQSYAVFEDSQDPTIVPSWRPPGWVGQEKPLGVATYQFRRQIDTDTAVEKMLPIATGLPKVCEWGANTMLFYQDPVSGAILPVWRMDKVFLEGYGDRLVSSLSVNFGRETSQAIDRTESMYTGGTIRGHGGTTLDEIRSADLARHQKQLINDLKRNSLESTGIIVVNRVGS